MPYLALDTSNFALSVAAGDAKGCLGEATTFINRNHSNRLMPLLTTLLDQLGLTEKDVSGILVGKGPGSYTGVRIGVTAAKTLAWALGVPLASVSSLEAMAYGAAWPGFLICPLIDARRQQVYACAMDGAPDLLKACIPEKVWPLDAFVKELQAYSKPCVFVGSGAMAYQEILKEQLGEGAYFGSPIATGFARALHVLEIGSRKLQAGEAEDPFQLEPEYLQLAEAEAKLQVKEPLL